MKGEKKTWMVSEIMSLNQECFLSTHSGKSRIGKKAYVRSPQDFVIHWKAS